MIVADASAVLELLLGTAAAGAADEQLFRSGRRLHAPHLIDVEVAQTLRRLAIRKEMDPVRGRAALDALADMPIQRYPHGFLLPRVWALRDTVTAYDALYVALAEVLDATLVTRDRRLANAVGPFVEIELV